MTIYVSRYARADLSWRQKLVAEVSAQRTILRPADPPLLTHAWRQLFERQVRTVVGDDR
ncbi:multiple cyclophane-containing RiPP AmcA [Micromonospora sp. NPDC047812]|uniref:multiple cyclophane-containing RiPP AmcA n=1 Tax=Micromonospora sp. NPDC047812 TaxID=3155742 RepID=UPI0034528FD4